MLALVPHARLPGFVGGCPTAVKRQASPRALRCCAWHVGGLPPSFLPSLDLVAPALAAATLQLEQLKSDFQYNLELLEARDAELSAFDAEHAALMAAVADRDRQLAELQALCAEAQAGAWAWVGGRPAGPAVGGLCYLGQRGQRGRGCWHL